MSWKDYQQGLSGKKRKKASPSKTHWAFILGSFFFLGFLYLLFGINWYAEPTSNSMEPQKQTAVDHEQKLQLKGLLDIDFFNDAVSDAIIHKDGEEYTAQLTLDRDLQR